MVDPRAPVAVIGAATKLSVERVQHVGVQDADLDLTDEGLDVLADVAAVLLQSARSPSKTSRYLSSSWLTVAFVRGLRRSLTSLSKRVRTASACRGALGPAGTISVR